MGRISLLTRAVRQGAKGAKSVVGTIGSKLDDLAGGAKRALGDSRLLRGGAKVGTAAGLAGGGIGLGLAATGKGAETAGGGIKRGFGLDPGLLLLIAVAAFIVFQGDL